MSEVLQKIWILLAALQLFYPVEKASAQLNIELGASYTHHIADIQYNLAYADSILAILPDSAHDIYKRAFFNSSLISYREGIRKAASGLSDFYLNRYEYRNSLLYLQEAFRHMDKTVSNKEIGELYWKRATINFSLNQRRDAQKSLLIAAKYMPPGTIELANITHALGLLYLPMQSEQALPYIRNTLLIASEHKAYQLWARALSSLGQYYKYNNNLDSAVYYAEQSLQMARQHHENIAIIDAITLLIMHYNKNGVPQKGIPLLKEAEQTLIKIDNGDKLKFGLFTVGGDLYYQLKDYKQSEFYYLQAYRHPLARENVSFPLLLQGMSALYYKTQRYQEAFDFYKNAQNLYYSKNSQEIKYNMLDLEIKYQSSEKDKKIIKGQLKIARQEKQIAYYRSWFIVGSAIALLLILALVSRYLYLQQKNKRLKSDLKVQRLKAIVDGIEMERSRLAHELHDGINSQLSALQAFLLAEEAQFPFLLESDNFQTAHKLLEDTASDVRNIAHNLAPDRLLEKGLEDTVREFCHYALATAHIDSEIEFYGSFGELDNSTILNLYRIIQELIQNIKKHTQASWVSILAYQDNESIQITVEDNGKGIPEDLSHKKAPKGLGLSGIAERVALMSGSLTVDSTQGKGTCIHINLPSRQLPVPP